MSYNINAHPLPQPKPKAAWYGSGMAEKVTTHQQRLEAIEEALSLAYRNPVPKDCTEEEYNSPTAPEVSDRFAAMFEADEAKREAKVAGIKLSAREHGWVTSEPVKVTSDLANFRGYSSCGPNPAVGTFRQASTIAAKVSRIERTNRCTTAGPIYDCMLMTMEEALASSQVAKAKPATPPWAFVPGYTETLPE